ncbi:YegP family protein [Agriterribacter sp.]|uniref:YegP family protein n=1 Tax=Agriterribacter sp. TaxID=2821509 RepID=UPI002BC782CB|nr:YegP family protein [Agriterribacter sp.]HRP58460.1 YegP family protein [Agriterribacter sp.]
MGKFVTKTGNNGQYYFNLVAGNGQVILSSEGYTTTAARQNGIDSVKKNAGDDTRYEKLTAANGKPYFTLKASNGQVIGKSQMYENEAGRDNGIASVKSNAPNAPVAEE